MKILSLRIQGFKNLEDVSVDFSKSGPAVVLVGQNGSGKSNLLEAIATIFRDLSLDRRTPFNFEITYTIRSHAVRIDHVLTRRNSTEFYIKSAPDSEYQKLGRSEFFSGQTLLPNNVFGYYSGTRDNLAEIFRPHEEAYYRLARGLKTSVVERSSLAGRTQLRPFFFGRLRNAGLVLLSYFASGNPKLKGFLKDHLSIDNFDSALLTFSRPLWFERASSTSQGLPWDTVRSLDTEVGTFLKKLWEASLAPISYVVSLPSPETKRPVRRDHIFLFFPDSVKLAQAFGAEGTEQRFFTLLEALVVLGILEDVQVWIKRDGLMEEISSKEISDGERQLLTIIGLLYLTPGEESLFLLDEPDTHLNPSWKWDFLQTIASQVGDTSSCQFILTSHDPLTIAGLKREDVQIVFKDPTTRKTEVDHPSVDPKGLGVAGVLRQIFGLRTTLDPETQKLVDDRNRLLSRGQSDDNIEEELRKINAKLDALGLAYQSRDPDYDAFLRARHAVERVNERTYTPEEIEQQNSYIKQFIEKLN